MGWVSWLAGLHVKIATTLDRVEQLGSRVADSARDIRSLGERCAHLEGQLAQLSAHELRNDLAAISERVTRMEMILRAGAAREGSARAPIAGLLTDPGQDPA